MQGTLIIIFNFKYLFIKYKIDIIIIKNIKRVYRDKKLAAVVSRNWNNIKSQGKKVIMWPFSLDLDEDEDMIDKTETTTMAQVQPINKRRNEVDRKVEANLKAIEEIKAAIDMALRDAEMADSTNCS